MSFVGRSMCAEGIVVRKKAEKREKDDARAERQRGRVRRAAASSWCVVCRCTTARCARACIVLKAEQSPQQGVRVGGAVAACAARVKTNRLDL